MNFLENKKKAVFVTLPATLFFLTTSAFANDNVEKGKTIYNGVGACATCHGASGQGDGPAGAALNPKPANFVKGTFHLDTNKDGKLGTAEDIFEIVTNGAAAYGGSPIMVGRKDISEADRKALASYILSLKK